MNKTVFTKIDQNKQLEDLYTLEDLAKPEIEDTHHVRLDKDGTNYDLLVFEIKGKFGNVEVGYVTNGLLVIGGDRKAYMFRKGDYLSYDYIHEKLCPNWSMKDAQNIRLALLKMRLIK